MKLSVVVPTYNRSVLLRAALASLLRAPLPPNMDLQIIVVDNNSKDDTAAVVAEIQREASRPVQYILEKRQGSSHARNAGVAAASGDVVGFIDDDEEIDESWYEVVGREFTDPATEFIGGPYLPKWVSAIPDWLPPGYHAVIGAIPPKPRAFYDHSFVGVLTGGNAVLRRSVFDRVGTYSPHLGRSDKGLLSEEDAEFYRRLQRAGIQGVYVPELLIHHYIAPERLTRSYHRRWAYWRAVSQGVLDREQRQAVRYLLGVPRYMFGRALRSLISIPGQALRRGGKGRAFAHELALWDLVGFIYGKHFARPEALYTTSQ